MEVTYESVQKIMRKINHKGVAEFRKEYSELRKIAVKRIKRAQEKGELLEEAFPIMTRDIAKTDPSALAKAIHNVQKFLTSKRSTAAGRAEIKKKTVQTLRGYGYENINTGNVDLFTQFMELWRKKYETQTPQGRRMLFDSDFAVEIYDNISERFTTKTNASAMSRMFNDYLRANGLESEIVYL